MTARKVNRETPRKNIRFDILPADKAIVVAIVNRAVGMAHSNGWSYDRMDCQMDIVATHLNGNPLRLRDLLEADDFSFAHDVFGIRKHIDRRTGELLNFFSPRFSA